MQYYSIKTYLFQRAVFSSFSHVLCFSSSKNTKSYLFSPSYILSSPVQNPKLLLFSVIQFPLKFFSPIQSSNSSKVRHTRHYNSYIDVNIYSYHSNLNLRKPNNRVCLGLFFFFFFARFSVWQTIWTPRTCWWRRSGRVSTGSLSVSWLEVATSPNQCS